MQNRDASSTHTVSSPTAIAARSPSVTIAELERDRALRECIEIDERDPAQGFASEQQIRNLEVAVDVTQRLLDERGQVDRHREDLVREVSPLVGLVRNR